MMSSTTISVPYAFGSSPYAVSTVCFRESGTERTSLVWKLESQITFADRPRSNAPGEQARSGSTPRPQPDVFVRARTKDVPETPVAAVARAKGIGPAACGVRAAVTATGTATAATSASALIFTAAPPFGGRLDPVVARAPDAVNPQIEEPTRKGLRLPLRSALHRVGSGGFRHPRPSSLRTP